MLKFYYCPGSCSLAAHIALEEAGMEYEAIPINLRGDRTEYYKVNPSGKVPALVADGVLLTENVALLQWIAEVTSGNALIPSEGFKKAEAIAFLAWCSNTAHIARRQAFVPLRFTPDTSIHESLAKSGRKAFWEVLKKIDATLNGKTWILGDSFSVCDCYAAVFYDWAERDEYPLEELKDYTRFKNQILERASAQIALKANESPLALEIS